MSDTRASIKDKDEVDAYISFKADEEKDCSNSLLFRQEY